MRKNERVWMGLLVLLGIIAVITALVKKNNVCLNGEHLPTDTPTATVTPTATSTPTSTPTATVVVMPYSATATPIMDKPMLVSLVRTETAEKELNKAEVPTADEVYCLARIIHGEASICTDEVKASVAYVVLNRVDASNYPDTIREVCEQEGQFAGWSRECSTEPTEAEREMAYTIIKAWKNCDDRYRPIPSNYLYFRGNGVTNFFTVHFYNSLREAKKHAWNYTMPNEWVED